MVWLAISLITWMMSLICSDDLRMSFIESIASRTAPRPASAMPVVSSAWWRLSAALREIASIELTSCSTAAVISSTLAACDWAPSLRPPELSAIIRAPSFCWSAASEI